MRAFARSRADEATTEIGPKGAKAIDFYRAAFGAEERYRVDGEGGEVVARLSVDGAEFWVADESPPHQNFSP